MNLSSGQIARTVPDHSQLGAGGMGVT